MWDWVNKLAELQNQGQAFAVVTECSSKGSTPREVGAKMIACQDGTFFGTVGGGHIEKIALEKTLQAINEEKSQTVTIALDEKSGQVCGGSVDLLIEVMNTGPQLYVFGAGHVGQAVCQTLVDTPFRIHLIDDRKDWILSEKIPKGVTRHECLWNAFIEKAKWNAENIYAVVMTPEHQYDEEIVTELIKKPARYIGMIGSKNKWARFQEHLKAKGISEEDISRITCPIGLPIGGKSPKEIAISLGSELLSIFYGKPI